MGGFGQKSGFRCVYDHTRRWIGNPGGLVPEEYSMIENPAPPF